jgi:SAM-dependent methyltransferase
MSLLARLHASSTSSDEPGLDFGYGHLWTHGHLGLALAFLAGSAGLSAAGGPAWAAALLLGLALWAFAAFLVVRFLFRMNEPLRLPTPDFLRGGSGRVLDLGCGSGRTSIMVATARPAASVVALDDFSAEYISGHGEARLARNLEAAGVRDRVHIERGDMRALPFDEARFDAAVSSYAIDHLGEEAPHALAEAARVVRPGGELLLMLIVPNTWMALSFGPLVWLRGFPGRAGWRERLEAAGFGDLEEGSAGGGAWFLARRRAACDEHEEVS